MIAASMNAKPCGCTGSQGASVGSGWAKPSAGCACGCGGCGSCGSCAGLVAADASCTSATPEATDRQGVSAPSCLPERPRFFAGEMVTDFDLTAVVDYQRAQSLLSNGVIGGWGVYCGYSLSIDPDTCSVYVGPGIAFDARGRALVRSAATKLARPDGAEVGRPRPACDPCVTPPPDETLYLAVVYDDCLAAPKPRYGNACGPSADPGCDFSRVQERTRLVWVNPKLVASDSSYWRSGCLPDPCAEPEIPKCSPLLVKVCSEPSLDTCTPEIGIHGGVGVERYAKALQNGWNLPRNAAVVETATKTTKDPCCGAGVGALLDVISAVACPPCDGEALVILAEVAFTTDAQSKKPVIRVAPLRRRILSNADLTYLVGFLLERALCPSTAKPTTVAVAPPSSQEICGDPCVHLKSDLDRLVAIAAGDNADLRRVVGEKLAYRAVTTDAASFSNIGIADLVTLVRDIRGTAFSQAEENAIHVRFEEVAGRAAYESAAVEMLDKLAIPKLDEARRLEAKEYLIEQFAHLRGTARTIAWPAFLELTRKVYAIAGAELTEAKMRRFAADFPGALVPDARVAQLAEELAEEIARKQLAQVMSELAVMREELASAKGEQGSAHPKTEPKEAAPSTASDKTRPVTPDASVEHASPGEGEGEEPGPRPPSGSTPQHRKNRKG